MTLFGSVRSLFNQVADVRPAPMPGSDWLGRRKIQHTVRYMELSPKRFKDFWRVADLINADEGVRAHKHERDSGAARSHRLAYRCGLGSSP
jgi:hypothetical protein